ncbi:MAG: Na+/H+ antiporter NhaC family protein [Bacillota bacterium]|jgi:NhaC family Na+:H+ antiporter
MKRYCTYLIAAFTLATVIFCTIRGIPLFIPFVASLTLSIALLSREGGGIRVLLKYAWDGVYQCRALCLFLLLMGANISMWMASGIVPAIIYYGFEFLSGTSFLLMAFAITGGMSIFMGTSVGTISTLGIAMLGIGRGFGLPPEMLMGALVSGAFLADKLSPISGVLNLTMAMTETSYPALLKSMARTLFPVLLLTGTAYYFLGAGFPPGDGHLIFQYQEAIRDAFTLSPWLLLIPLGVIILPLLGVKTLSTVVLGVAGGAVLTVAVQGAGVGAALTYIFRGYRAASASAELNSILVSGGIMGMGELVLAVIAVIALSGVLEKSGALYPLLQKPLASVADRGELIAKTGLVSIILTALTCDQSAGAVLQGRAFKDKYREMGVDGAILARTISDTGTIVAPLFPWNVNSLVVSLATGISAFKYIPYAFLCFLFPLMTLVVATLAKGGKVGQWAARLKIERG